ncbi:MULTISPECIES: DeoR/GlpR family DNA-binding transcription regulator [unclassified Thalassospira]|uniref:DeoR/GlpR family DNA-binding transcription regulator n=1 Tax=unclassified Thalassospira TaxID=2648997 RepID=UPI0007A58178|nr:MULTISPECIES: DeoR/GlpR family DNA-binding transcription regulator [unclassified Thalassospira]KZC98187.1 DeoR family transcriptional regulator [Thalassospira sp. MCCC 1A02898]ONH88047.1 DeoR family transcriptional regulator [Thalassospira sp. MCCC 1A02803]
MSSVSSRQDEIQKLLRSQGTVHIHDLAALFHASLDTIRRDLRQMEEEGYLRRIHGGAVLPNSAQESYAERAQELQPERTAIAQKAARELIPDDCVAFFDSGTTVCEVARNLKPSFRGTVITVNPMIAVELASHPNAEVIMLGGTLRKTDMAVCGPTTLDQLRNFNADIALLGTCALHPEAGLSTSSTEERATKAAMIAQSAEVIAITTADKLETSLPHRVCDIDAISHLVTGRKLSTGYLANYTRRGLNVIQA